MNSTTSTESTITVFPSGRPVGAEIRGADLRAVTGADFATIQKAWNDHSVLLFRGQQFTDDELIAFSRCFGELDWAPIQETGRLDWAESFLPAIVSGGPPRWESVRVSGLAVAHEA